MNRLRRTTNHAKPESGGSATPIRGITGVILAGGASRRMGSDKAFLPFRGARLIDHVYHCLTELFTEIILVTNNPWRYADIPCRKLSDLYPGVGVLAGIHSGLVHAKQERVFVVACDMPFIAAPMIRHICSFADQGDLVLPCSSDGREPLHAVYAKSCLPAIEKVVDDGQRRIIAFFDQVRVVELSVASISHLDPQEKCFCNINSPEDYFRLRDETSDQDYFGCSAEKDQGQG